LAMGFSRGNNRVEVIEESLNNGLRIVLCPDPSRPVVTVNIRYGVGSNDESPGRTGLAHLFEHLMYSGSANVASGEHLRLVQGLGGTINATTTMDWTSYYQTVTHEALELILWLESDRLGTLPGALTQETLDIQRAVVMNERRQAYENAPYGLALEQIFAALFPEPHPYHHLPIGSMTDLNAASLGDLREFFTTFYTPGNAVLTVVGDFDTEHALAAVTRYFGPLPAKPGMRQKPAAHPPHAMGEIRLTEQTSAPSRIFAGYRVPSAGTPGFDAARFAVAALCEGAGSRLEQRLVRGKCLITAVKPVLLRLVGGASVAVVQLFPRPDVELAEIESAYQMEIDRLAADGLTEDETARALAQLDASWKDRLDTPDGMADELSWHALFGAAPDLVNHVVDRLHAVTPDDIKRFAQSCGGENSRVVLTYQAAA
jgi:predicted Zn-dependent peptidase